MHKEKDIYDNISICVLKTIFKKSYKFCKFNIFRKLEKAPQFRNSGNSRNSRNSRGV